MHKSSFRKRQSFRVTRITSLLFSPNASALSSIRMLRKVNAFSSSFFREQNSAEFPLREMWAAHLPVQRRPEKRGIDVSQHAESIGESLRL